MTLDLPVVWAGIIAFGVMMYVILDGLDLGVGILFWAVRDGRDRDVMMNCIAPVWDGNETWLVLGGACLFGAFPLAYAVLLSAFYLPLIIMLIALVFRGVAFEFRFRAERTKGLWSVVFAAGSTVAAFAQGLVLGAFVQGIEVDGRDYAGGAFGWFSSFSVFTGLAVTAGYAALGAGWLIIKTEGRLQHRAFRMILPLAGAVLAAIVIVSLWTPLLDPRIAERWFAIWTAWPSMLYVAPVPVLVAATAWGLYEAVRRRRTWAPFLLTAALFLLSYFGLALSIFPWIVPPHFTIWQAASPHASQSFMLAGVLVMIPIILAYTCYAYWVFRGKVTGAESYH